MARMVPQKGDYAMGRITRFSTALVSVMVLALASVAIASPKKIDKNKPFILSGRVLKVDSHARTFLIEERSTDRLYLVKVPENASFKVTFGRFMTLSYAWFEHVVKDESVRMRVIRSTEDRLSLLDDGREVVALTIIR
jgi:hypothetical protein